MATLPYSVVNASTGYLVAQFESASDGHMFKNSVLDKGYVLIETHRLADFRRNIKLAANTRSVEVLT
jgi:hypothetical protein